jgi:hypothetical protein
VSRAVAAALLLVLCLAGDAAAADAPAEPVPPCFGAAARDTANPCDSRHLRLRVVPTPIDALLAPNAPCTFGRREGRVWPCDFGWEGPGEPVERVLLLGDSHAVHWRGALRLAAVARQARGSTLSRAGCSFTRERLVGRNPADCRAWNREVVSWLKRHPEITTVFVSNRARQALDDDQVAAGVREVSFEERVRGRAAALRALPASVKRVVVLRDVPVRKVRTLDCIERAMRRRQPAGTACAVPRPNVLPLDPTARAARRLGGPRYRTIDLTRLMCTARLCLPVVGGALVNKDETHLTTAFSESMAPMLLRRLDAVIPRATPPA